MHWVGFIVYRSVAPARGGPDSVTLARHPRTRVVQSKMPGSRREAPPEAGMFAVQRYSVGREKAQAAQPRGRKYRCTREARQRMTVSDTHQSPTTSTRPYRHAGSKARRMTSDSAFASSIVIRSSGKA